MFNAEKLLGKIVGEVMGSGGKQKSILGNLGSGSGLLTMIGLGVGAYEILKQQGQAGAGGMGQEPLPPGGQNVGKGAPPPPPPGFGSTPPPPPPTPGGAPAPHPTQATQPVATSENALAGGALAIRMIQVMAAAAQADGVMDAEEERSILEKLRGADLSQEEKMFLLNELHQPKSVDELVADIHDPAVAKTMYMLAVATIEIDTEAEREWLNTLAGRLGISPDMRTFIEEQTN